MSFDRTTRMPCVRRTEEIEGVNVTACDGISFDGISHTLEFPENFVVLLVFTVLRETAPRKDSFFFSFEFSDRYIEAALSK